MTFRKLALDSGVDPVQVEMGDRHSPHRSNETNAGSGEANPND